MLKRVLLKACGESVHLTLKLIWALFAYLEDATRLEPDQRVAREIPVMAFIVEIEACLLRKGAAAIDADRVLRELQQLRRLRSRLRVAIVRQRRNDAARAAIASHGDGRGEGVSSASDDFDRDDDEDDDADDDDDDDDDERASSATSSATITTTESATSASSSVPGTAGSDAMLRRQHAVRTQLRFVARLSQIAERMRFVDPRVRNASLKTELEQLAGGEIDLGFNPFCHATQPLESVVSAPVTEGHVFRTKARAPTLIVFEVLRDVDGVPSGEVPSPPCATPPLDEVKRMIGAQCQGGMHELLLPAAQAVPPASPAGGEIAAGTGAEAAAATGAECADKRAECAAVPVPDDTRREVIKMVRRHSEHRLMKLASGVMHELSNEVNSEPTGDSPPAEAACPCAPSSTKPGATATAGTEGGGPNSGAQTSSAEPARDGQTESSASSSAEVDRAEVRAQVEARPDAALSPAVSNALQLHEKGIISAAEFAECVRKDRLFQTAVDEHLQFDVQFCISHAFGESWASKKARIRGESAIGEEAGWDLMSAIVKTNDDVRQEVCALQLIELCGQIFRDEGLDLWVHPYNIISTGATTGLIEVLTDAASLDALKKRNGQYRTLAQQFAHVYGTGTPQASSAQRAFVSSLAAYVSPASP